MAHLPWFNVVYLMLQVLFIWPGVSTNLVTQRVLILHFLHNKHVTKRISEKFDVLRLYLFNLISETTSY